MMEFKDSKADVSDLVLNPFCIGCGVCAGICRAGSLSMTVSEDGFPRPRASMEACTACSLCIQVCPFLDHDADEDSLAAARYGGIEGIQHHPILGYFLGAYVGHVADEAARLRSASGGLATWLLVRLLEEKWVDAVACVVPRPGDAAVRFEFRLCRTPEEVITGSGSKYYPLDAADVIRRILSEDGHYALIGLPCLVKGLRLASRRMPKLEKRLAFVLGLVCGRVKSRLFTDYLLRHVGRNPAEVTDVGFRSKAPGYQPAMLRVQGGGSQEQVSLPFEGSVYGGVFCSENMDADACHVCDDVFAETADAALMDAWLPEYRKEWRGTSIVLLRTPRLRELVEAGMARGDLRLEGIAPERVVRSQGAARIKGEVLARRLGVWKHQGVLHPQKRIAPMAASRKAILLYRWEEYRRGVFQKAMRAQVSASASGLSVFEQQMRFVRWGDRLLNLPSGFRRRLGGFWSKRQRRKEESA